MSISIETDLKNHIEENIKVYADYIKKCRHHVGPESLSDEQYIYVARSHLYSVIKFSIAEYLTEILSDIPSTVEDDNSYSNISSEDSSDDSSGIDYDYCDDQCSPSSSSDSEEHDNEICIRYAKHGLFLCGCFDSDSTDSDV